ncbi:uncharacterized protein [Rutidosis leptorrhynchoides]|uniref:uncharacterized protein n=1 Tax=Rutidosis leptorrhynchoides TaxID=125765 RepID=UPI003A9A5047
MKIMSLNVRSLNQEGNFGWVKNLCVSERPNIAVFQETKCHEINSNWLERLWGSCNFWFIQKQIEGKSGGMLTIWDCNSFEVLDHIIGEFFIVIKGKWKGLSQESTIVNVYGPHNDRDKNKMWGMLERLVSSEDTAWVVCGDFNEVRNQTERFNSVFHEYRAVEFNNFIEKSGLIDVPLGGRKFTRMSEDGNLVS